MSSSNNPLMRFLHGLLKIYRFVRAVVINLLFLLLLIIIIAALAGNPPVQIQAESTLVLNPVGNLVEERSFRQPFEQVLNGATDTAAAREVVLQDLLDVIHNAAMDDRISAMLLLPSELGQSSFSHLQEVAEAMDNFRNSGKVIYALAASYNQAQYYLASHADEIMLNPFGAVDIEGFGAWQVYFGEALNKLGINAHIFRVGEYKSAVEPYERNDMSPEARENYSRLLSGLWSNYLDDIAGRRPLNADTLNELLNNFDVQLSQYGGDLASMALGTGLVDRVESQADSLGYLKSLLRTDGDDLRQISYRPYLRSLRQSSPAPVDNNRIGVIIANGEIVDGDAPRGAIGGNTLSALIRQARENEDLKALVLRINSPGGSAFASELIRGELQAFKASGRPLVVSMGATAASGGYWIATPADQIWASASTITGSIGIFGVLLNFEDTFNRLGLSIDGVGTTALSGAGLPGRPLTPMLENILQSSVEFGYRRFLTLVAESRQMSEEEVDSLARGQVWSGQEALENGLVDQLGNLDAAVAAAATLAGLENYTTFRLQNELSPFEQLLQELVDNTAVRAFTGFLPERNFSVPRAELLLRTMQSSVSLPMRAPDPNSLYLHCLVCEFMLLQ